MNRQCMLPIDDISAPVPMMPNKRPASGSGCMPADNRLTVNTVHRSHKTSQGIFSLRNHPRFQSARAKSSVDGHFHQKPYSRYGRGAVIMWTVKLMQRIDPHSQECCGA